MEPMSCYLDGFLQFVKECQSCSVDYQDSKCIIELTSLMCKYYSLQKKRQRNFNDWLANVLDLHLPVHSITQPTTKYSTDGFVTLPFNGLPRFLVYIEVENRVGKGRSNPFMQGLAYFYHFNEVNSEQSLCLCFIIELIGPHLGIYGVVNVGSGINKRKILADLLANLWSVDKCTDYIGMMLIL